MKAHELREFCLALPGAKEQMQWGDHLLFKVGGKVFFITGFASHSPYTIKSAGEEFYELTELPGIRPAPYLARARWVQIDPAECQLSRVEIERLVRRSYDLVVGGLPKKVQASLGEPGKTGARRATGKRPTARGRRAAKRS